MGMRMQIATHQGWEDWFFVLLGFAIIVSPLAVSGAVPGPILVNIIASGAIVLGVSFVEFAQRIPAEEILQLVFGAWLAISSLILDFGTARGLWLVELALGLAVALMALLEMWQDGVFRR